MLKTLLYLFLLIFCAQGLACKTMFDAQSTMAHLKLIQQYKDLKLSQMEPKEKINHLINQRSDKVSLEALNKLIAFLEIHLGPNKVHNLNQTAHILKDSRLFMQNLTLYETNAIIEHTTIIQNSLLKHYNKQSPQSQLRLKKKHYVHLFNFNLDDLFHPDRFPQVSSNNTQEMIHFLADYMNISRMSQLLSSRNFIYLLISQEAQAIHRSVDILSQYFTPHQLRELIFNNFPLYILEQSAWIQNMPLLKLTKNKAGRTALLKEFDQIISSQNQASFPFSF